MADATLLALFQELVASYDSSIVTTSGSAFRTSVIDPLLNRIGDTPLDGDLESFLVDRLTVEHPTLDTSEGSGIRDLVVRPIATMLAPLRREINAVKLSQSLNNYASMSTAEVDALLGNVFLSMQSGAVATGTVRVYYGAPQAAVVDALTKFSTDDSLNFYPSSLVSISSASMALNTEAGLFYVDVPVQGESAGTPYNVSAGKITKVEGLVGPVKVTNKLGLSSGVAAETKAQAVTRAQDAITTRTLVTSKGIKTLITSQYPSIDKIQVIGFGDSEMQRDVVTGPQSISGIPGGFDGAEDADLTVSIHIGGKTDVYAYQPSRVVQTLDIKNITDVGKRIVRGTKGSSPHSGVLDTFTDTNGQFSSNGVTTDDILRFASDAVALVETPVVSATDTTITTGAGTVALSLSNMTYEVVRKENTAKYVDVSLYDLAAVDGSGATVLEGTVPVSVIPGDLSLGALTNGGSNVVKTVNIATANISLPFMQINSVSVLSPTQFTLTGETYPLSDPLYAEATGAFTGGSGTAKATGTIRVYFKDAVGAFFPANTTPAFTKVTLTSSGGLTFSPTQVGTHLITTAANTNTFTVGGDQTATFTRGVWVATTVGGSDLHMVSSSAFGGSTTTVTVRFDGDAGQYAYGSTTTLPSTVYRGVNYQDIAVDADTGLYYVDVSVEASAVGASYNLVDKSSFTTSDIYSEGWSIRNLQSGSAYSTREKPYIRFTNYVNDANLRKTSTAYAIRLAYEYVDTLAQVQTFVDSEDRRVVAEDVLVKHFLPGLVSGKITVRGLTADATKTAIDAFLQDLDPTATLEMSDLVNYLYTSGATYVKSPLSLVVITPSQDRVVTGSVVTDSATTERTRHFILEKEKLTVTVVT